MYVLLLFLCLSVATSEPRRSYDGWQVLRTTPQKRLQLDLLDAFTQNPNDLIDFWKEPSGLDRPVDVMVAPQVAGYIKSVLRSTGLDYEVTIPDVGG